MKWFAGIVIVVALVALAIYYNLWNIAAYILPAIELAERVEVSEPSIFTVPEGFQVSVFASNVDGARVLVRDPKGTLVLSQTSEGRVVALPDTNSDGKADETKVILSGLNGPHGIAFNNCSTDCVMYVAEEDKVRSYNYNPDTATATPIKTLVTLPASGGHSTRTLHMHPDGKTLLVSVGSSCNVCNETHEMRATIQAIDLATGDVREYARGLRNTVFMATNPVDGAVWGTDMGRDLLGDDTPPDEVNILKEGGNYGWPICYGKNIHDTQFDKNTYIRNPCMEPFETPSHIDLQAHSAPLGIAFVPEEGWPEHMALDVLVAYHGSWNRSVPTGYKVVRFDVRDNYVGEAVDFMTGFMATTSEDVLGRPVALLAEPGGTLYVTDDRAGAVYRVSRITPAQ